MWSRKILIAGAAAALTVAFLSGCSSSLADKPETANGVYRNEANGETIVLQYTSMVERDKEKSPSYLTYATTANEKNTYNGKQIYSKLGNINIDSENNIFVINPFNGTKTSFGTYKTNEITLTEKFGMGLKDGTGTFKKTDEKLPSKEELSYNGFSAAAEQAHDWLAKKNKQ